MKHIELHLAKSPRDLATLNSAGLPTPDSSLDTCYSCSEPAKAPVAIALSDEDHWYLCLPCASPLLAL